MTLAERIILGLAIGLYAALMVVQIRYFGAPYGESAAPDLRLTGYTPQHLQVFLADIGPDGRSIFFGSFRALDTVFPPILAMAFVIVFKSLQQQFGKIGLGVFALLALGYLTADLFENSFLNALETTQDFNRVALTGSMMTQVKYALLGAITLCFVGVALIKRKKRS